MESNQPVANATKPVCNNVDIYTAIKSGNVRAVENINSGSELLSSYGEDGVTLAHWICYHGDKEMLQLMVKKGGLYDCNRRGEGEQRPVHWAAHQGHMHILQLLFDLGIAVDTEDSYNKTPLLIAAQNGKTATVAYLHSLNANLNHVDKDGDTALHWAAYNGHTETIRLLVYMGYNVEQTDNFLQTPLHTASLRGHVAAVRDLCVLDNADTTKLDKNNETALMLASRKQQLDVVVELNRIEKGKKISCWPRNFRSLVDGSFMSGNNKLMFFICILIFIWGYPTYVTYLLLPHLYDLIHHHIIFFVINIFFWISLRTTNRTNPGFVTPNQPQYSQTIKNLSSQGDFTQATLALSKLCHTCRVVKPLRSKHCRHCNKCVHEFDHHCFYVGNCIGKGNRVSFLVFVVISIIFLSSSLNFAFFLIQSGESSLLVWIGSCVLLLLMLLTALVAISIIQNISRGMTTNETVNWRRYKYLLNEDGQYFNKFNKGFIKNFLEFINIGEDGLWRNERKYVADMNVV